MIKVHSWPTPNGQTAHIMLEVSGFRTGKDWEAIGFRRDAIPKALNLLNLNAIKSGAVHAITYWAAALKHLVK